MSRAWEVDAGGTWRRRGQEPLALALWFSSGWCSCLSRRERGPRARPVRRQDSAHAHNPLTGMARSPWQHPRPTARRGDGERSTAHRGRADGRSEGGRGVPTTAETRSSLLASDQHIGANRGTGRTSGGRGPAPRAGSRPETRADSDGPTGETRRDEPLPEASADRARAGDWNAERGLSRPGRGEPPLWSQEPVSRNGTVSDAGTHHLTNGTPMGSPVEAPEAGARGQPPRHVRSRIERLHGSRLVFGRARTAWVAGESSVPPPKRPDRPRRDVLGRSRARATSPKRGWSREGKSDGAAEAPRTQDLVLDCEPSSTAPANGGMIHRPAGQGASGLSHAAARAQGASRRRRPPKGGRAGPGPLPRTNLEVEGTRPAGLAERSAPRDATVS